MKVKVESEGKVYFVSKPTKKQEDEARLISNKIFRKAADAGCYFRNELTDKLKQTGVWTKEEEKEYQDVIVSLAKNQRILDEGGIDLEEAKKVAIDMRIQRMRMFELTVTLREHDPRTVEGQSENAYFDALVAFCTSNEDGTKTFKNYEDYLDKSNEQYSVDCASALAKMVYGINEDWEKDLPENKFLLEFNFVNEDLRLVNEEGHLVDTKGRLINEDGELIDKKGNLVDEDGNTQKKQERKPFLKNGKPIK